MAVTGRKEMKVMTDLNDTIIDRDSAMVIPSTPTDDELMNGMGQAPVWAVFLDEDDTLSTLQQYAVSDATGMVDVIDIDPTHLFSKERCAEFSPGTRASLWVSDTGMIDGSTFNSVAAALAGRPVFDDALLCLTDGQGETVGFDIQTATTIAQNLNRSISQANEMSAFLRNLFGGEDS